MKTRDPSTAVTRREQPNRDLENVQSLDLITVVLLRAVEALGGGGCSTVRRVGEREGRRIARQSVTTVAEALSPLAELGFECRVERTIVAARVAALGRDHLSASAAGRHLLAGLIQGMLDGAGMSYAVKSARSDGAAELTFHVVRRRRISGQQAAERRSSDRPQADIPRVNLQLSEVGADPP